MYEEKFALFASPQFLKNYGKPTRVEELPNYHWIMLQQTSTANTLRLKHAGKTIEIKPENDYLCNSPYMTQKMVRNGLGISPLLPSTINDEICKGKLINIMPEISSDALVFALVYPSRKQIPTRTRAVIDFLLNANIFNGLKSE